MPSLPNTITLKRGRPSLPESERRTHKVLVSLNEQENNNLKLLSERMNTGLAQTLRILLAQSVSDEKE